MPSCSVNGVVMGVGRHISNSGIVPKSPLLGLIWVSFHLSEKLSSLLKAHLEDPSSHLF